MIDKLDFNYLYLRMY